MITRSEFASPAAIYRGAYFWSINDTLDPERVREQVRAMRMQGQGGAFFHPRAGLTEEYLGERYFAALDAALDECVRNGLHLWLYDEDRFPSGFAGGYVIRGAPWESDAAGTGSHHAGVHLIRRGPDTFDVEPHASNPRYNNTPYPDLTAAATVARFITVGYEPYRRRYGAFFGTAIPGIFTDEPGFPPDWKAGTLPWGRELVDAFHRRHGYDVTDHLAALYDPGDGNQAVRFDYWDTLSALFADNFTAQIDRWCERAGLQFTGHFWEHLYPDPRLNGSVMNNYARMQIPGIDMLFHPDFVPESGEGQFGNILIVKEASSIAHQLNKPRVMSETHGASGWDLDFTDMKRMLDWQFALGVNLVVQHLFHYSLRGRRKRDFPQSFGPHQPWWKSYRYLGDYIGRLSYVLSAGTPAVDVLVLHNVTSTWVDDDRGRFKESIDALLSELASAQIAFELGDESVMADQASVEPNDHRAGESDFDGPVLHVGRATYRVVVVPQMTTVRRSTTELLKRYVELGGAVVTAGALPTLEDGRPSDRLAPVLTGPSVTQAAGDSPAARARAAREAVARLPVERVTVVGVQGPADQLFTRRQRSAAEEFLFLCNVGGVHTLRARVPEIATGWEAWDALTGCITAWEGELVDLPPAGSLLLRRALRAGGSAVNTPGDSPVERVVVHVGPAAWSVARLGPNALTVKRCTVTIGNGRKLAEQNAIAADDEVRDVLGLERRAVFARQPWMYSASERAITSSVGASYAFTVQEKPGETTYLAIEDPDRLMVRLNGVDLRPVSAATPVHHDGLSSDADGWFYHDPAFRLFDATAAIGAGRNVIELAWADYGVNDGLEWVYVVGNFAVRDAVVTKAQSLSLGEWTEQGLPYFTGSARYVATVELSADNLRTDQPIHNQPLASIEFPGLDAVAAELSVNGHAAGVVALPPYQCEVGRFLRVGTNRIELLVHNSLQNLLGPHGSHAPAGLCTPDSFYDHDDTVFATTSFDGRAELTIVHTRG